MNFQPDCPMERGGLAVLALGTNPLSLLPLVAASSPEGGAFMHLTISADKAPPSGELASRSDD